nr:hypothetical protein [Myxococcota bacterium]
AEESEGTLRFGAPVAKEAVGKVAVAVANLRGTRIVDVPAERAIDMPTAMALSDVAGFPLPGRTFYLSLDWTY